MRIGVTGKSWCLEVPVMMARVSNRLNSGRCAVGRGPDLAGGGGVTARVISNSEKPPGLYLFWLSQSLLQLYPTPCLRFGKQG